MKVRGALSQLDKNNSVQEAVEGIEGDIGRYRAKKKQHCIRPVIFFNKILNIISFELNLSEFKQKESGNLQNTQIHKRMNERV